jgi:hypothetical protein
MDGCFSTNNKQTTNCQNTLDFGLAWGYTLHTLKSTVSRHIFCDGDDYTIIFKSLRRIELLSAIDIDIDTHSYCS